MTIVSQPDRPHHCGPNRNGFWYDYTFDLAGTVRRCNDCGRTWVAYRQPPHAGLPISLWRLEGRFERWRRQRRQRSVPAATGRRRPGIAPERRPVPPPPPAPGGRADRCPG